VDPKLLRDRTIDRRLAGMDDVEGKLAALGVAVQCKSEHVYMWGGREQIYVSNQFGLADHVKVVVKDNGKTVHTQKIPGVVVPVEAPPMREPRPGQSIVRTVEVECSIGRFSKEVSRRDSYLSRWNVLGPFEFDPKKALARQAFGPELKSLGLGSVFEGSNGAKVCWQRAETTDARIVDFKRYFKEFRSRLAYGVTFVHSDKAQPVTFRVYSDDGVVLWLNGRRLFVDDRPRGIFDGADVVKGSLKAGNNVLMVKVSNYSGDWCFRVGIEAEEAVRENYAAF
jgi:hypothetical protein